MGYRFKSRHGADSKCRLQHYAENLQPGVDFIRAYYNYEDNGTYISKCAIIERLRHYAIALSAYEHGHILDCETANYAVRKSWFIEQQGFADSLTLPFGEEKIFAYNHATAERTTMLCSADTGVTENMPDKHELHEFRMYASEAKRHLKGIATRYSIREAIASILLYLSTFILTAYATLRATHDISHSCYSEPYLYTDLLSIVLGLCIIALPAWMMHIGAKAVKGKSYGPYIYFHELLLPWRNLRTRWMRFTHKSEFKRKFIN